MSLVPGNRGNCGVIICKVYWAEGITHNPAISSSRCFRADRRALIVGSFQSWIISSAHAWRITPGSLGSSKSISAPLSKLDLGLDRRRLNANFHCEVELTVISFPFAAVPKQGRSVTGNRRVASISEDPAEDKRRRRASSTCCSGRRRIFSRRCSGVSGEKSAGGIGELEREFWGVSVIVSSMVRMDRATLSCTTALHDAFSARNV